MISEESKFMLREIRKLVLRKENMKKNKRRQIVRPNVATTRQLPHFEPDYGVVRGKPYIFYCSIFGFEVVLDKLGIEL